MCEVQRCQCALEKKHKSEKPFATKPPNKNSVCAFSGLFTSTAVAGDRAQHRQSLPPPAVILSKNMGRRFLAAVTLASQVEIFG
jgi:hypothetical protein